MAQPKLAKRSVDSIAADAVHEELLKYVKLEYPGVVNIKQNQILNFNSSLKSPELQKTNVLVTDFLDNKGKSLAAEFLNANEPKLVRSFVVLYCARQDNIKHTAFETVKVTIILALGPLACGNGLPRFENCPSEDLESGDALLVGDDMSQMLVKHSGGGFALVSDWTA